MEQAELAGLRQTFDEDVRQSLPDASIHQTELLQHGDEPEIEPGQVLGRVVIGLPDGVDPADKEACLQAFEDFHATHRAGIHELRRRLARRKVSGYLQITPADGPELVLKLGFGDVARTAGGAGEPSLTPVMARLGRDDLETLDTLIAAGIASSRAEGVRWALARIRERPAYARLRERVRDIEELKAQF